MPNAEPISWPFSSTADDGCKWQSVDEAGRASKLRWSPVVYLQEVVLAGTRRSLEYPLKLEVAGEASGGYSVFAPAISVGGFGDTVQEAVRDLFETVWSLWESYSVPDEELHASALASRERLRRALAL